MLIVLKNCSSIDERFQNKCGDEHEVFETLKLNGGKYKILQCIIFIDALTILQFQKQK